MYDLTQALVPAVLGCTVGNVTGSMCLCFSSANRTTYLRYKQTRYNRISHRVALHFFPPCFSLGCRNIYGCSVHIPWVGKKKTRPMPRRYLRARPSSLKISGPRQAGPLPTRRSRASISRLPLPYLASLTMDVNLTTERESYDIAVRLGPTTKKMLLSKQLDDHDQCPVITVLTGTPDNQM